MADGGAPLGAIAAAPRRAPTLLQHLLRLSLLLLLPALVLGGILTWQLAVRMKSDTEAHLATGAHAAAAAVGRELEAFVTLLDALGSSTSFDAGPEGFERFHTLLRRALAPIDSFAVLILRDDPDWQALNSGRAFDEARLAVRPDSPAREALSTGKPAFRGPRQLPGTDRRQPSLSVPVQRAGEVVAALSAAIPPKRLSELLAAAPGGFGVEGFIMTRAGQLVATGRDLDVAPGVAVPARIVAAAAERGEGLVRGAWLDGREVLMAFSPVPTSNWVTVLKLDQARERAAWLYPALRIAAGVLLVVLGVTAVAVLMIRGVVRQLAALSTDAARPPRDGMRVAEFERLAVAVAAARDAPRREAELTRIAAEVTQQYARDAEDDRRLLKSVVQSVPEPIFVKDRELRYVLVNPAAAKALGRPEAEILGRTNEELLEASISTRWKERDQEMIRSGEPYSYEHDSRLPGHGGAPVSYMTTKAPWRDSSGQIAGLVGVARDVTARRATERRLRMAEEAMGRIARADSLTAMGLGVAHELNQPLTAVGNFLRAGVRWLQDDQPDAARIAAARGAMQEAAAQALRAGEILRRLRDFVGRGEMQQRIVSLGPLVADGVALTVAARGGEKLAIALDVSVAGCLVRADEVQLQQVVVNLLRNAIEATEGQAERGLAVTLRREEARAVLRFIDAGPGLAEEVRERLFEPFVSTKAEGMGVGLAICRAIVEAHSGYIVAGAAPGGGTEIRIDLPLAGPPEAA